MLNSQEEHPIERIMDNAFVKIRSMIDADTLLGTPLTTADGVTLIPVSKLTLGIVTGGGEYSDMSGNDGVDDFPFAGGSGAGVSLQPIGFIVNNGKSIEMIAIDEKSPYDKIFDATASVLKSMIKSDKDKQHDKKNS